jgi:hypothetical protein
LHPEVDVERHLRGLSQADEGMMLTLSQNGESTEENGW